MTSRVLRSRSFAALFGTLALAFLAGCTETNTEYVERPQFNPPPDSVNGFMGYYTASTKQTTCGNCHVSYQGTWVSTAHANAYDDLFNSGHAAGYCYGCHTVSGYGNSVALGPDSSTAGYNLVASTAYHDVQCESCHGPGYTHVSSPSTTNHPLARAGIYGLKGGVKDTSASCGGCHSGEHEPFTEQWSQTGHADSAANASQAANVSGGCAACHEGRTALARFNGEPSHYIEKDSVGQTTTLPPATCAVCHDPHGSPYQGQLRLPVDAPDVTQNLCMNCHNRSTTPSGSFTNSTATTTSRGAHASQGPILLGSGAGYIPAGFVYDSTQAFTSHASTANPRLCAGCHVVRFTVTDSNGFVFQSVGHLFSPDPCLDPVTGIPVKDNSCAYTPSTTRNWSGCVNGGCHASADAASSALVSERQQVATLVNLLWKDIDKTKNNGGEPFMNSTDQGYLPKLLFVAGNPNGTDGFKAFLGTDAHVSPAEGALFNIMMMGDSLYGHNDGSYGAHNPFYYEALLSASINAVVAAYPTYLPAPPANVQAIMDKALSRPGVYYNRATGQLKISAAR
jgi:predicted CXXCH cytochrome family protein